ncbi:hypothetical protein N7452_002122 [Penicillium brevicompactum]|uniref:Uncharacterized protein n=1 Tax=Penicillium brevicompactum TaxID=5074 RepID=A0A9W9R3R4_PENBR|nr:hypothetical protein N7452_002122 [Penicillium brevicompactum]
MLLWELHKFVNRSKQLRPLWCSTVHRKSPRMLYREMCGPELEFIALRIMQHHIVLLLHALVAFQHAALVSVQTWDRVYRAVVAVPHLLALAIHQHVAPVHVRI